MRVEARHAKDVAGLLQSAARRFTGNDDDTDSNNGDDGDEDRFEVATPIPESDLSPRKHSPSPRAGQGEEGKLRWPRLAGRGRAEGKGGSRAQTSRDGGGGHGSDVDFDL